MTDIQDLSTTYLNLKAQSALGSTAAGSGGVQIPLLPSQGLQAQVASIESQLINLNRMRKRPRHGMKTVTAAYETELTAAGFATGKGLAVVAEAALGGTWGSSIPLSESDLTSVVISGTGTVLTFGGGDPIALGMQVGCMIKFTNLATSGNNSVWVPVLGFSGSNNRTVSIASGYLTDETIDSAFNVTVARMLKTASPYTDRYFTVEENLSEITKSKLGTDMRFNALNLAIEPNGFVKIGFGLGGRDMTLVSGAANFTSPATALGDSLILLDGGIYANGTKRVDLTGLTCGLQAPVSGTAVIGSRTTPDLTLGQFAFSGQLTGVIADGADLTLFNNETQFAVLLHCKEKDTQEFVTFYYGNLVYGGYGSPIGGEGAVIQSLPLYGGTDLAGTGHAATICLISTSS